jgi:quercetin dioxygenase-like cupin family protein
LKTYTLSLVRELWCGLPQGHHAIKVAKGSLVHNGRTARSGDTFYVNQTESNELPECGATIIRFSLASGNPAERNRNTILSSTLVLHEPIALMRLDQVSFPPGATAYRHTHPGPGIRHLLSGSLELAADDCTHTVQPGDAWFEDAESPVKATASETEDTAFIRCMILPIAFAGRPTINILDPVDRARPMRQQNRRYLDQKIQLD